MKSFRIVARLALTAVAALTACAGYQAPPPIHYVAVEVPDDVQPQRVLEGRQTASEFRMGIMYRPPLDLVAKLKEFEGAEGSGVLMDVEAALQVPFCVIPFCFGKDTLTVARTETIVPLAAAPLPPAPVVVAQAGDAAQTAVIPAAGSAPALVPVSLVAAPAPVFAKGGTARLRAGAKLRPRPQTGADAPANPGGDSVVLKFTLRNAEGAWWYADSGRKVGWLLESELEN